MNNKIFIVSRNGLRSKLTFNRLSFCKLCLILLVCFTLQIAAYTQSIVGFASVTGLGLTGTTGGEGGRVVTATNVIDLKTYMDSNEKLVIYISGTMDLGGDMTPLRSNKSLLGLGNNAKIMNGGLELYKRSNIIIRNITFENAPDDAMKVNQVTHHLWVDHCTFTDGAVADPEGEDHDGLFDITRESSFITISYCLFLNHAKTILIGHSDSYSADAGDLRVTLHHNWFNGTRSRHPRVRFGFVHVFNNYYTDNVEYGVASTCEADVVVEGNYFKNVPYPAYAGYAESPAGDLVASNNVFVNSGTPQTRGTAFSPQAHYTYTLDNASDVPSIVMANAGAGKITITAPASTGYGSTSALKSETENTIAALEDVVMPKEKLGFYPNPFSGLATISFTLEKSEKVLIKLINLTGTHLEIISNEIFPEGDNQLNYSNVNLKAGIYILSVHADTIEQRIIVVAR